MSGACRCRCARDGGVTAREDAGDTILGNSKSFVFFGRIFLIMEGD